MPSRRHRLGQGEIPDCTLHPRVDPQDAQVHGITDQRVVADDLGGSRIEFDRIFPPLNRNSDRRLGTHAHVLLHLVPVANPATIQLEYFVAPVEACRHGRAVRLQVSDDRIHDSLGTSHEREGHEGEDEIHRDPGDDHQESSPQRLRVEIARRRRAGGLGLSLQRSYRVLADHSLHLHVAAQRDCSEDVFGLSPLESDDLRPESDRETGYLYVHRLGRPEMTQFVDQDQYAKHDDSRKNGDQHSARPSDTGE